jgi:hypothetical protein
LAGSGYLTRCLPARQTLASQPGRQAIQDDVQAEREALVGCRRIDQLVANCARVQPGKVFSDRGDLRHNCLALLAITWLSVALGLAARKPETASNTPMPLMLLPFLGSGFVPTASMPAGLRWFAEYQPFTPVINAVRDLLLARPAGDDVIVAVGWSAGIGLASYLWARRLYNRDPETA